MKCLLLHCHEELAQLTALTLIVGVGWVELWKCPNHGVWSIPKGGRTMKEVSCNTAQECGHWCHASAPHQVTEQCERSYCMEVRRQVKCKPVEAPATRAELEKLAQSILPEWWPYYVATKGHRGPPLTCTRRVQGICDLSGVTCAVVYDAVECREGRPTLPVKNRQLCRSCGADLDVWGVTLSGPCCEAKQ